MSDKKYNHNFQRKLKKSNIPVCPILGVNISAVNMRWLVEYLTKHVKEMSGDYITVANVHTTVTAFEDAEYRRVQNGGFMALPDGRPLSIVGKKRGNKQIDRIAGPDLMLELFAISSKNNFSHFFYGATEETLLRMREKLEKDYPGIRIAGMYSPPFRSMTKEEDQNCIQMIKDAKADFVWVGLGAPKQEIWMAQHQGKIDGLMIGVGAGFNYYVGNIKRAPMWMQRYSLEWFYRLLQEPKRLFKRYFKTNMKFIWHAVILGK